MMRIIDLTLTLGHGMRGVEFETAKSIEKLVASGVSVVLCATQTICCRISFLTRYIDGNTYTSLSPAATPSHDRV
jgi:hypothetical protein